ncbi:MAG TPA: hypothetical protein DDZ81_23600 [Acetobacteraceae bacterium]|jgi:hypothetical protein|nr:hypothetical protein [Acetobacteraceae bacterium]
MKTDSIVLAGIVLLFSAFPAFSQQQTLTENVNNTGIPRNAPPLALANIYGLNPCSSGTTVGLSTPLFGIGGAVASIDKECETRNNAAVVVTGLKDETLAREILCEIKDIRNAALRIGKPCLQDQQPPKVALVEPSKPAVAPAVVPAVAPAVVPAVIPVVKPTRMAIRQDAPAFCYINNLDLALYPDCGENPAPTSTVGPSGPIKPVAKAAPNQPVSKRPPPAGDGTASAATLKRIVRAPQPAGCGQGQQAKASTACQIAPAAMMALEQSFIKLIDLRRQQLAQANRGNPGTTELRDETASRTVRPSVSRGPMLASANPENQ